MNDNLGYCVFSSEITACPASRVQEAADTAGFGDFVHELRDRSVFIRACRRLEKEGVIENGGDALLTDKFLDDSAEIAFQFSSKTLQSGGVEYDKAAVVRFDKNSGALTSSNPQIEDLARQLFSKLKGIFTATDINSLARRVTEAKTKRVALRDGVFFISSNHKDTLDALREFYKNLGFNLTVLPIGATDSQKDNIVRQTIKDLKDNIKRVAEEIAGLKVGEELTPRIAKNRIKDLHVELERYREIAQSLQVNISEILQGAGDAGQALAQAAQPVDSLIAAVQQGGKLNPLVLELLSADEDNKQVVEALNTASALQEVDLPEMGMTREDLLVDAAVAAAQAVDLVQKGGRK